jgi:hypothetical protein
MQADLMNSGFIKSLLLQPNFEKSALKGAKVWRKEARPVSGLEVVVSNGMLVCILSSGRGP